MENQTILNHLLLAQNRPSQLHAQKYKKNKVWESKNWRDYFDQCQLLAAGLLSLGLEKSNKVAILCQTRPEWEWMDLAILGCGAITVPIYPSYHAEEIEFILNDAQVKILVCENLEQYNKFKEIHKNSPSVESIVLIDGHINSNNIYSWEQLNKAGSDYLSKNEDCYISSCSQVKIDDVATLIYTSGTTGNPKGVVLSHRQIMSELVDLFEVLQVNEQDITLTFLPFAHVLGRVEMWGHIYKGYTLGYAESIDKIKKNLTEIHPTLIIAVPRIFEKIYNGILSQVETSPTKEKVFKWAIKTGSKISRLKVKKIIIPIHLLLQYQLAKKLVFDTILEKLGGRLRFAFSGGAPLSREIGEFFHAAGLLILEGYGLTETTAGIAVNSPIHYQFGTVGKPLGDVVLKFASDGEILVKSDKVMTGYYNNETANIEAFTDGFFHTGDIGELTREGFLKITDRKKDLIKTAGGKYVAPQKLENLLKLNPYISNVLIHGDKRKYIVALITLDETNIKKYALNNNISFSDVSSLAHSDKIKELIREAVAEANNQLSSFESIKSFAILENDFTIESGELTPSLKVKRKICDERYKDKIEELYGKDRSSI